MNAETWLPWVVAVMVAMIAAVPNVLGWWGQRQRSRAEAAATYQQIANKAAERALGLQERIAQLETKVDEQDSEIRELRCERDDLKDWATRLVHQVQSLGGQPVPFRQLDKDADA